MPIKKLRTPPRVENLDHQIWSDDIYRNLVNLGNGQVTITVDELTNTLIFTVRYSNRTTVKTGTVALT
jgi:hypothetical protein